ncbi:MULTISPECIES: alpha/beta hydrolase family protein [unclassified Saccharothrix]|uniref:alpha/beta hydrolase family protein n=1 Tax=unclassified Saccharothrix TaxID=2593673 RepID=UPI00307F1AFE
MPDMQTSTVYRRALALTAGLAVAGALLAPPASAAAAPAAGTKVSITMPALTGHFPVGTTDLHLVDARPDPWFPAEKRELMVTVTYPAHRDGDRAAWLSPSVAGAIEQIGPDLLGVPPGSVDWDATKRHTRTGARALRGDWPVVVFSHGFGGMRELNAGLTDDLASRGYVVVSISHTHEAGVVEFPGGRVVVGSVGDPDAAAMRTALEARIADSRFVLDQLERVDRGENPDAERDPLPRGLAGALDLSRVGIYGHSYGGFTAGETMYRDRRFDAGINVDGAMRSDDVGDVVKHGLDRPFMLVGADFEVDGRVIVHSHRETEFDPTWHAFWPHQRGWKRDLHFDGAAHLSFSDLQFAVAQLGDLVPPDKRREVVGTIDADRSMDAQRAYFAGFFDLHLKHRGGWLFDHGPVRHPDTRFIA